MRHLWYFRDSAAPEWLGDLYLPVWGAHWHEARARAAALYGVEPSDLQLLAYNSRRTR